MKKLSVFVLFVCLPVHAELVESIEKFTDIFGISASSSNGEAVYTLDVNYAVSEKFRVFGDIDTNSQWEVGAGYSLWSSESIYTENTLRISDNYYSTGVFVAKSLSEKWLAISEMNFNVRADIDDPICYYENVCNGNPLALKLYRSNSVDYSVGALWSPIKYLDLLYQFNHEVGLNKNQLAIVGLTSELDRTNFHYQEFSVLLNIGFLKPSVTYTFGEKIRNNHFEFGLAFNF